MISEFLAKSREEVDCLLNTAWSSGHMSVFEHVSFVFNIEGISRACSHQLVRHRLAAYSQMSQRHIRPYGDYIIPPTIKGNKQLEEKYSAIMSSIGKAYEDLASVIPKEDARYVLSESTPTSLVMTVNVRELAHIAEERLCSEAQSEIRELVERMCREAILEFPFLNGKFGPKCIRPKGCPSGRRCEERKPVWIL